MDSELDNRYSPPTVSVEEALTLAVGLHRGGALKDAETLYRGVLAASPEQPDALHFLGVLSHQLGRGTEAVEFIRRALRLLPDDPGVHNNLGNVLKEQGRLEEAAESYRRVIALLPDDADAHNNLGVVLKEQGRSAEAEVHYRRAIAVHPGHADAHLNLGNALRRMDRLGEAIEACRRAIELKPDQSAAYETLAASLQRVGRTQEALGAVREWLAFEPDHPIAQHLFAALEGAPAPDLAPDEYVRALFDRSAASFDERLRSLEYRAPELVARAVAGRCRPHRALRVLDAGCGTGLCGPLLAPYARRLVGVDLSGAMLDKARVRGVYDALVQGELTAFLGLQTGAFDLIVSADTLVYFGALTGIFQAVSRALAPAGLLAFTVEKDPSANEGFRLNAHGRYSHTEAYVHAALSAAGLAVVASEAATLRREAGQPVEGLVFTARAGASAAGR